MGDDAVGGNAPPEQIGKMAALLGAALADGAMGLSTSQSHTHNDGDGQPVPSRGASREELLALAAAVRAQPGTQLEAIIPGCLSGFTDADIDLLSNMSKAADRPLNWNVLGVSAGNPEGRTTSCVEHRDTVAPGGQHVLDAAADTVSSRFAVDSRHEQFVVFGVDVPHRGCDGEPYGVRIQRPPGGASTDPAAAAGSRVTGDRIGAAWRTTRERLANGDDERLLETRVLVEPSNLVAFLAAGACVSVGEALALGALDRLRFHQNALALIAFA
jgi:hypothetical protein